MSENDTTASVSKESCQLFVVIGKAVFLEIKRKLDYSKGLLFHAGNLLLFYSTI